MLDAMTLIKRLSSYSIVHWHTQQFPLQKVTSSGLGCVDHGATLSQHDNSTPG